MNRMWFWWYRNNKSSVNWAVTFFCPSECYPDESGCLFAIKDQISSHIFNCPGLSTFSLQWLSDCFELIMNSYSEGRIDALFFELLQQKPQHFVHPAMKIFTKLQKGWMSTELIKDSQQKRDLEMVQNISFKHQMFISPTILNALNRFVSSFNANKLKKAAFFCYRQWLYLCQNS